MERTESEKHINIETNFWFVSGELRAVWKLSSFVAFYFISLVLFAFPLHWLHAGVSIEWPGRIGMLTATLAATAFGVLIIDRKKFGSVGFSFHSQWLKHICLGFAIASGMMTFIVLAMLFSGIVEIQWGQVTFNHAWMVVAEGLLFFLVIAVTEETLMRGYPFQTLIRGTNQVIALICTSLVFSLMHFGNPNMTLLSILNIFLAGLWLGKGYLVSCDLWFPIGLHTGWNFLQGSIFGFPVSGISGQGLLLSMEQGDDRITGGMFGPEGGIIASIILIAGIVVLFHPGTKLYFRKNNHLHGSPTLHNLKDEI